MVRIVDAVGTNSERSAKLLLYTQSARRRLRHRGIKEVRPRVRSTEFPIPTPIAHTQRPQSLPCACCVSNALTSLRRELMEKMLKYLYSRGSARRCSLALDKFLVRTIPDGHTCHRLETSKRGRISSDAAIIHQVWRGSLTNCCITSSQISSLMRALIASTAQTFHEQEKRTRSTRARDDMLAQLFQLFQMWRHPSCALFAMHAYNVGSCLYLRLCSLDYVPVDILMMAYILLIAKRGVVDLEHLAQSGSKIQLLLSFPDWRDRPFTS
jgi:hypothetical protein